MNLLKFAVRSRFSGAIQFTAEIECGEDQPDRIKLGLAVKWAFKTGAYLGGAYLGGADLGGAYLRSADLGGADLRGADLGGAKLTDDITINLAPIFMYLRDYPVELYDEHMKIGCEFHPLADWETFDERRILQMDGRTAVNFWRDHKAVLLGLARANGRTWAGTPESAEIAA